jgi:xeroderma pigmentosum group C-complementing protein
MREGRRIRESEQPLKLVKQRAVTINKRRAQEMAEQEGMDPIMQGLYSASQTELVIPPPIVDVCAHMLNTPRMQAEREVAFLQGKIPKNSYGNLDLFAPHMLPRGAVHLPCKFC